jgi:hypothetical protein
MPSSRCRSPITALPANHNAVPANCDRMMMGRMRRGRVTLSVLLEVADEWAII